MCKDCHAGPTCGLLPHETAQEDSFDLTQSRHVISYVGESYGSYIN